MPAPLILLSYIDRFGAQAVYGRTMGAGELRRLAAAENLVNARRRWNTTPDKEQLKREHPDDVRIVLGALHNMRTNG